MKKSTSSNGTRTICLDNYFLNGLQNIHASLNSFECADVSELLPFMWHYNWRPWIASIALVFVQCSYRSWVSPDAQKFGSDPTELGTYWGLAFYEEPLTATCIECKQLNFLIENCTGYACLVGMIVKCLADLAFLICVTWLTTRSAVMQRTSECPICAGVGSYIFVFVPARKGLIWMMS
jgi:hypothetical protein